jgi:hypothetical protein
MAKRKTMLNKLNHALLGLTLAVGTVAASIQPADAGDRYRRHHHHHRGGGGNFAAGVATGIIGLGVLGAIASSSRASGGCYEGPRRCEWRDRHCFEDRYGDWVCRGGYRSCWRPRICD